MPVKAAIQRFAFLLLAAAAAALLVLGKADVALIERLRAEANDGALPILEVLRQPVVAIHSAIAEVNELIDLRTENARLRQENARLLEWQEAARRYERDNASFRRLLKVTNGPVATFISAHVVGDSASAFVRTMLIDAGSRDGVEKGQAVVNDLGLVGRVIEVGQRSARVLLLTDLNSRIPITIEGARYRGIMAGDNTDKPRIEYLPPTAQVQVGDRLITSGDGGFLPPGLAIGLVTSVDGGLIRAQPFVDWNRLDVVSLVRYDFPSPSDVDVPSGDRSGGRR
jgi:rod shape-determining protein MreC